MGKKNSVISQSIVTRAAIKELANMIKVARLQRGMSQEDLAKRINVSRHTIIAIEQARHEVSIGAYFEAAYIVGISLLAKDFKEHRVLSRTLANITAVLPKRARKKNEDFANDF
jgi:DNA-binding XRE family transcriptional regulator